LIGKIIAKILANRLSRVVSSVVGDVQMAYIKGRQLIDGPLMVDVIIAWAKKYKKRVMFLKLDFENAFDSLSWSILFSVLEQMGFSSKWRTCIHFCLDSAFALVLVIRSPIKEFNIQRVNFNKSKLFRIGISSVDLHSLASFIGCLASQFPSTYLELPIGANMSRCFNWNPLVERFHKRISKWKSKALSIGGCLTLIKFVLGSLGVYYFSTFKAPKKVNNQLEGIWRIFFWGGSLDDNKILWIAWKKVISPRDQGGIGIDSLGTCNQAMLIKWWWRFHIRNQAI
nr:reverse transcriptase domain, reverse transcriptase zinc-binding domain protein [Tanacetum cinerariifolium]